ncbi:serine hydrolase [Thalassotalea sp. M1531]|uniref:Serine hydrolase n=1 Tax=Thalassotalea algicola TaxID=2716224 RepID=A0A7Y0Q7V7_9GAMM|nr:serine hydrolase [Thalassotalea algicola]NMP32793.1 serine hydrolase [Thalassotalea algicola]
MKIDIKVKSVMTIALLVTLNSATANTAISPDKSIGKRGQTAEASAAEAKLSFWDLPLLEKAFVDTTPAKRNDGIPVGNLVTNGGDKAKVLQLAREMAEQKHGNYDSMLIARNGKLIFESYFLRGRINLHHGQASATKGLTSIVVGRAIQMGYLTMADLDKPLVSFLKDLDPSKFVDGAEKITLHKALTMHGGLSLNDEQRKALQEPSNKTKGQALVQSLLELSAPITSATQTYNYGNYNPTMVMQVIDAVVPGSAEDFIKNELLDKMGITNYQWTNAVSGLPQAGSRARMTSRDMLKWGRLVLNKGQWQGEQLISIDYLAKATSAITQPTEDWIPNSYYYGYYFYQTDIIIGDKSYDTNFAWGGGGQYIVTIKDLGLTIVFTGHEREYNIMTQVEKVILPAFTS